MVKVPNGVEGRLYEVGRFGIVRPVERVNLIANPSVEIDTDGFFADDTLERTTEYQARGGYGLVVVDGAYYDVDAVEAGPVVFSVDLWSVRWQDVVLTIESGGHSWQKVVRAGPRWSRGFVTGRSMGDVRLRVARQSLAGGVTLAGGALVADGWQLEHGANPTTYIDGDQRGYRRGGDYYWLGARHRSESVRSGTALHGGEVVWLERLGWVMLSVVGGQAPAQVQAVTGLPLGGELLQASVVESREMVLGGVVEAMTQALQAQRKSELATLLSMGAVHGQPMRAWIEGVNCDGEVELEARTLGVGYVGGFEGHYEDRERERAEIKLRGFVPNFEMVRDEAVALGTVVEGDADYYLLRDMGRVWGAPDAITGQPYDVEWNGSDNRLWAVGVATALDGDGVARLVGGEWEGMGLVPNGAVRGLAVGNDGKVYVGGEFTLIDGVAANKAVVWDGATWSEIEGGVGGGDVWVVEASADGRIYFAGTFMEADGSSECRRIVYWDPEAVNWQDLWGGTDGPVHALASRLALQMVVGGDFSVAGVSSGTLGVTTDNVALWIGGSWQTLGDGLPDVVRALAVDADGTIYAGGDFGALGYVARFNGTNWEQVGLGLNGAVESLEFDSDGTLYVAGTFTALGDGTTWPVRNGMVCWTGDQFVAPDVMVPNGSTDIFVSSLGGRGLFVGFDGSGDVESAAVIPIEYAGTAVGYPQIELVGPGRVYGLRNARTGAVLHFDLLLQDWPERAVLDLALARLSFESDVRGDMMYTVLPRSDVVSWFLVPGRNDIVVNLGSIAAGEPTATMIYKDRHVSMDAP